MAAESACQSTDALNDQVIYESTLCFFLKKIFTSQILL